MIFTSMIRKHIIPVIFVIFAIFFAYAGLVNTYFQQDEWQFFAGNIYYESREFELIPFLRKEAI